MGPQVAPTPVDVKVGISPVSASASRGVQTTDSPAELALGESDQMHQNQQSLGGLGISVAASMDTELASYPARRDATPSRAPQDQYNEHDGGLLLAASDTAGDPMLARQLSDGLLASMPPVSAFQRIINANVSISNTAVMTTDSLEAAFQSPILVKRREVADGTAGTPHYIAPETAAGGGAGCASDWYSIGVLAFKCAAGRVPYDGRDFRSIFEKAKTGDVRWNLLPKYTSPALLDLLSRLLDRDPERRLKTVGPIRDHPFFAGVDWK